MQAVKDGYQVELPDVWLTNGNPWEMERPDIKFQVGFGGKTITKDVNGKKVSEWVPGEKVGHLAAWVWLMYVCLACGTNCTVPGAMPQGPVPAC